MFASAAFQSREIDHLAQPEVSLRGFLNRAFVLEAQADDAQQMIGEGEARESVCELLLVHAAHAAPDRCARSDRARSLTASVQTRRSGSETGVGIFPPRRRSRLRLCSIEAPSPRRCGGAREREKRLDFRLRSHEIGVGAQDLGARMKVENVAGNDPCADRFGCLHTVVTHHRENEQSTPSRPPTRSPGGWQPARGAADDVQSHREKRSTIEGGKYGLQKTIDEVRIVYQFGALSSRLDKLILVKAVTSAQLRARQARISRAPLVQLLMSRAAVSSPLPHQAALLDRLHQLAERVCVEARAPLLEAQRSAPDRDCRAGRVRRLRRYTTRAYLVALAKRQRAALHRTGSSRILRLTSWSEYRRRRNCRSHRC